MWASVLHLPLVDADGFLAFRADFCEFSFEAASAEGFLFSKKMRDVWPDGRKLLLPHDVSLSAQDDIAVCAFKVAHVPVLALCFRTLVREDDLKRTWILHSWQIKVKKGSFAGSVTCTERVKEISLPVSRKKKFPIHAYTGSHSFLKYLRPDGLSKRARIKCRFSSMKELIEHR